MLSFILKTVKNYLLVIAFIIPVVTFMSIVLDTPQSKQLSVQNKNTKAIEVSQESINTIKKELELVATESEINVITIDNFPVKKGRLSSRYGMRKDPINGKRRMHSGIDIAARRGTSVNPLGKGKVIFVGYKAGYGRTVEILHGNTIVTRYSHLKKALVEKGQTVDKNDVIAQVGNSGRSTGSHLHLEIAINGETIDPQIFLVGKLASR